MKEADRFCKKQKQIERNKSGETSLRNLGSFGKSEEIA